MTLWNRSLWLATWLAPLGWLAAGMLFALWLLAPRASIDPRAFAWGTGLFAAFAALSHLAIVHHLHSSGAFGAPQGLEVRRAPGTRGGYRRWRSLLRPGPVRYGVRSHSRDRAHID